MPSNLKVSHSIRSKQPTLFTFSVIEALGAVDTPSVDASVGRPHGPAAVVAEATWDLFPLETREGASMKCLGCQNNYRKLIQPDFLKKNNIIKLDQIPTKKIRCEILEKICETTRPGLLTLSGLPGDLSGVSGGLNVGGRLLGFLKVVVRFVIRTSWLTSWFTPFFREHLRNVVFQDKSI